MNMIQPRVFSENTIRSYECEVPHLVISISSPDGDEAVLPDNPNRVSALFLRFHDLTSENDDFTSKFLKQHGLAPVLFGEGHARGIMKALDDHPGVEDIICNCEAGISRSAGVAAAIAKYLTGDDSRYFGTVDRPTRYRPNMLVYSMLLSILQAGHV